MEPNYVQYPRFEERRVRFEALNEALRMFQRDAKLYIVAALPFFVVFIIPVIYSQVTARRDFDLEYLIRQFVANQFVSVLFSLVEYALFAAMIRLAIKRIDGRVAGPLDGLVDLPWLRVLGAGAMFYVISTFSLCVLCLPAVLFAGFLMLTYPLITEQKKGVFDALGTSFDTVKPFMWTAAALVFMGALIFIGSALACLVGLLAGMPIVAIMIAIVYRDMFPLDNELERAGLV